MKISVAQVQLSGSLPANLDKIKAYTTRALSEGVHLLAFPETALTGYIYEQFLEVDYEEVEGALGSLQDLVLNMDMCLVVGTPMRAEGHVRNSAVVLFPDGKRAVYHKRCLTAYESAYFEPGEEELLFTHRGHQVGVLVCRDQNRPEYAAALKKKGARVVCILSAHHYELVESRMKREKNAALPVVRAYENNLFVCKANSVGTIQGKISYGGSMIVDPRGIVALRGSEQGEELLTYEADLGRNDLVW